MSGIAKLLFESSAIKFNYLATWVHAMNKERHNLGEHHHLVPQLRCDPQKFREYFRMSFQIYDYILKLFAPTIEKYTTNYRQPISSDEK